jgi:hypothetical protein
MITVTDTAAIIVVVVMVQNVVVCQNFVLFVVAVGVVVLVC